MVTIARVNIEDLAIVMAVIVGVDEDVEPLGDAMLADGEEEVEEVEEVEEISGGSQEDRPEVNRKWIT